MSRFINKIKDMKLNRRDFLKGSAATTGAIAAMALVGRSSSVLAETAPAETAAAEEAASEMSAEHSPIIDPEQGGEWITAACWHNCGGRCVNKVCIKDGIVVRQKTDDTHEDSPLNPQQRACLRGHAQQQQCFGADRLKYPMKRKHWSLEEPNGELRGIDEWERISWDEAFELVAAGLKKAYDEYGPQSVLMPGFYAEEIQKLASKMGGYVSVIDTASFGSFVYDINHMIGLPLLGLGNSVDRLTLMKCDTIVLYGCNPAWASGGNPAYNLSQGKKYGIEYVFVGPEYNVTASMLDAKWIRVRPGTDTAFLLSVAYEMLMLDEAEGNVIDWEFMDRNVSGFDDDHMPEDAKIQENLKGYLLGDYDGIPKTAEWASEICGTPVEDIRWYAAKMGKENKVGVVHSYAAARCNNAEEFPVMFYTIGAMGGHMGREGHACGSAYHFECGNAGPGMVGLGSDGLPTFANPLGEVVHGPEVWQSILDGKYPYTGNFNGYYGTHEPVEERPFDIHVIYYESSTFLQTQLGQNAGIQAHRKVDMVVTQIHTLNTPAKYSDIVLPITTMWERWNNGGQATNRDMYVIPSKVTEPLYEAKSDQEIVSGIMEKLGYDPAEFYPFGDKQQWFNKLAGGYVMGPDGSYSTLCTITEEDIADWSVEGTPQEGLIPFKELLEKGVYQVMRSEDDGYQYIGWKNFRDDPEGNPLPTPTGKFQVYSDAKAEALNVAGRNPFESKPYPTYHAPMWGYEASFSDWENKVKGEYPYQITNPHYLRRAHTVFNDVPWLREAMKNPVWINAQDAADKGVQEGDTVLLYNDYGKSIRHASLTERLMPGVIALPHGAWVEIDEETGIDRAGSDNILLGPKCAGLGISGYNTNLVNFEKYDGPELEDDWKWPERIIEF